MATSTRHKGIEDVLYVHKEDRETQFYDMRSQEIGNRRKEGLLQEYNDIREHRTCGLKIWDIDLTVKSPVMAINNEEHSCFYRGGNWESISQ